MKSKIWIVKADTVYDANGDVFDGGFNVGCFSSYERAAKYLDCIEESYTRKRKDYDIEEFVVDGAS
jgi:hypothetical protein